jgi:hypothetical protein
LYEVSHQEGDEKRQGDNYEKRKTGDPGHVPGVRYENVPNWEGLAERPISIQKGRVLAASESGLFFYLGVTFQAKVT